MTEIVEGSLLWTPSAEDLAQANLTRYMTWLRTHQGLEFQDYHELWRWSVTDIDAFWASLWRYFDIIASRPYTQVLANHTMPGAQWFPGAALNYTENLFARRNASRPAILYQPETGDLQELSWSALYEQTARCAAALKALGVTRGDRVVAFLPNIPETIVAFLATASLGAIWSSCPPDFGSQSVLDRFIQIEPKILIAADGYTWAGRTFDRRAEVAEGGG